MILFSRFILPTLVIFLSIFVFIALCWVYKKLKKLPPEFPLPQTNKINKLTISDKKMQKEWDKLTENHKKPKPKKFHITPDIYLQTKTNCSIGKQHKKKSFNWNKFKDNFTITKSEGKHWAKILAPWVNWRNWTIFLFIAGVLYGYGYWKGIQNVPIQINLAYEKAFKMKIDGHYLVKPKNSQNIQIEDKEGNIIKHLKVKDFPDLAKKLKPIGFIFEPIGIMGVGTGTENKGFEAGAGISFIKYWKWRLDTFLTNRGVYLGTSYQLTSNSAAGIGIGKGYSADSRMIFYYKWGF